MRFAADRSKPTTEIDRTAGEPSAFLIAAGLSGPFSIWAAVFFLLRLRTERRAGGLALCAIALSTAVIQAAFMLKYYVSFVGERDPTHLAIVPIDRWIGGLATGWRSETTSALLMAVFLGAAVALAV